MRKLYRSKNNKILFGICGGIGEYFEIDPTLVRLLAILLLILSFGTWAFGIAVFYLLVYLIIPEAPHTEGTASKMSEVLSKKKKKK
ncbi:MAG: PspC domain-containing protein [Candidatus Micrarchaeota archaeon]